MRIINEYSHIPFLCSRLKNLLAPGNFAALTWQQVGNVIDSIFEIDEDFEGEYPMSAMCPASSLARWVQNGDWFDFDWLRAEDGEFYDDNGDRIGKEISITLSPAESLATYGLWLIEVDARCCGSTVNHDWDVEPHNENGWSEAHVANHKGQCMLVAYQLLWHAEHLQQNSPAQSDGVVLAEPVDFAALGKAGALKRHANMKQLKKYASSLYVPSDWDSPNAAAFALAAKIREHGRTIGAHLTPQNAQRTIAEWFRKSA